MKNIAQCDCIETNFCMVCLSCKEYTVAQRFLTGAASENRISGSCTALTGYCSMLASKSAQPVHLERNLKIELTFITRIGCIKWPVKLLATQGKLEVLI